MSQRPIHVSRAAVNAAVRSHYYSPRRTTILRAPVVQRLGPAFAFLVPATYVVETQPPEGGLHPHTNHVQAVVGPETAAILVVIVVLAIVAGRIVAWVVPASDGKSP
jgi:hypothetical protein